jgi:hypothetical protein
MAGITLLNLLNLLALRYSVHSLHFFSLSLPHRVLVAEGMAAGALITPLPLGFFFTLHFSSLLFALFTSLHHSPHSLYFSSVRAHTTVIAKGMAAGDTGADADLWKQQRLDRIICDHLLRVSAP